MSDLYELETKEEMERIGQKDGLKKM